MKKKIKIITFANFRSGGKSSNARLLAERIGTSILNFDSERNAEHYNAINTINIQPNKKISRDEESLILRDDHTEQKISSNSGFLICDLGGYFDPRVTDLQSDFYILPTFDDYESMSETVRTAKYILKAHPRAKIIFILNCAFLVTQKEKDTVLNQWNEQLEINSLEQFKTFLMPRTNICKKLVNDYKQQTELEKENATLKHSYRGIKSFIDDLSKELGV